MSSEVLLATPDHRIVHHRPERSRKTRVLITFDEMGVSDSGPWTVFALSRGFETIHVSTHPASIYESLSAEDVAEVLGHVVAGRKTIAFGTKVGAWAALYFGSAISAQVIAFSPRPPGRGHKAAHEKGHDLDADVPARTMSATRQVTVVYDPADTPAQSLVTEWVLPACPAARTLPVVLTGPETLQAFDAAGLLTPFLEKSLNGYVPKKVKQIFPPTSAKGLWAQGLALWHEGDMSGALEAMTASARSAPEAGMLMDIAARAQSVADGQTLRSLAAIVSQNALWASMNGKTARLLLNAQRNAPAGAKG